MYLSPRGCSSVYWASSLTPKGCWLDSWSGYVPDQKCLLTFFNSSLPRWLFFNNLFIYFQNFLNTYILYVPKYIAFSKQESFWVIFAPRLSPSIVYHGHFSCQHIWSYFTFSNISLVYSITWTNNNVYKSITYLLVF